MGASELSQLRVAGQLTLLGGPGGSGNQEQQQPGGDGGFAYISSASDSTITITDALLRGGAAGLGANAALDGARGMVQLGINAARVDQYGALVLRPGDVRSRAPVARLDASIGVTWGGEYTLFPCNGAGIEFPVNSSSAAFPVTNRGVFRDCRGAGAATAYPQPTVDSYSDASCAPCTCSAVSGGGSCPLTPAPPTPSSAGRLSATWWTSLVAMYQSEIAY
jgi:hypothetical protein